MTRNCHYPPATVRPDQTPRQVIQESAHRATVAKGVIHSVIGKGCYVSGT